MNSVIDPLAELPQAMLERQWASGKKVTSAHGATAQMETHREPQIPGDQSKRGSQMVQWDTQQENRSQLGGSGKLYSQEGWLWVRRRNRGPRVWMRPNVGIGAAWGWIWSQDEVAEFWASACCHELWERPGQNTGASSGEGQESLG